MKHFSGVWSLCCLSLGFGALFAASSGKAQDLSVWETPEYFRSGALAQVNAAQAYALGFTGAGVRVGVADSGLDARHPEFIGRVLPGYDFQSLRPILPGNAGDSDGHGTHVNGIVAAARDGVGMHGVAFNASVIPATLGTGLYFNFDKYFSSTWAFLTSQGAEIINNSFSADKSCANDPICNVAHYTRSDVETKFPVTISLARDAVAAGVLMVFAAGNESQPNPDVLAAMPYLVPELEKNWLVAVNLDSNNQIAADSDRCGVAKNYCLAAPGENIYSTKRGSGGMVGGYESRSGTSQAAPVVSGVAALVKEAFPWFTAHDLQQALLTTATDLGAPGVDDVYGWGLVNAGKAVRGYGMFMDRTVLNTNGMSSTFANDISGAGGLVKTGAGELILTGANSYAGGSFVEGGTLSINGSVTSVVAAGVDGTLRGTGTINAPLIVAGRLAPGNSPGTLTVAGPVSFSHSATFQTDIDGTGTGAGAGNYSRLLVTGAGGVVSVAGALAPILRNITGSATNTFTPSLGTSFSVIQASAGLSGSFSSLAQPTDGLAAGTRFDALYGANSLNLIVTPAAYGNLVANGLLTTAHADAVGRALDSVRPAAGRALGGPMGSLYTNLYALDPAALPSALRHLSGEVHASAGAMVFEDARHVRTAINNRLENESVPIPSSGVAMAFAPALNATLWATAYGGWGRAADSKATPFAWTQNGFLAGMDTQVTDALRLGIAAGLGQSAGELRDLASKANNTHTDLAVYGAMRSQGLTAKFGAAHGWNDVSTRRTVAFGALDSALSRDSKGATAQVFGELSHRGQWRGANVTPFAAVAYVNQRLDGFQESGGGAALTGEAQTLSATLTTFGSRISTDIALGDGVLMPNVQLGWQHVFGDVRTRAVMALPGSESFAISGTAIARDSLVVGLGLSYAIGTNVTANLAYDGMLAANVQAATVKGEIRIRF